MICQYKYRGRAWRCALIAAVFCQVWAAFATAADTRGLTLAVAANALAPLQRIAQDFEDATGVALRLVPGSTGGLYAQIRQGAPYDLFLAADTATPERLEAEGRLVPGSRFVYARGQLVLWSRDPSLVDSAGDVLSRAEGLRLAIAQPERAPYGAAALAALKSLGVEERWQGRLVYGESVGKTWQFVASGNADLGLVAASQLKNGAVGSSWPVPAGLHPPLDQGAGLLNRAADNAAARAFLQYLCSKAAQAVFRSFGYLPGDCRAAE